MIRRVVQFQADRLLVNWREREGGGRYPRYSNVKGLFHDALAAFTELMVKDVRGAFTPNQCEVTYLNNIPLQSPEDWGYPGRWLGLWNDELDASEGVNFTTRHLLQSAGGEPYARLTTSLESGQAGNRPNLPAQFDG